MKQHRLLSAPIGDGLVRETYITTRDVPTPTAPPIPQALRSPEDCVAFLTPHLSLVDRGVEHFWVVPCNTRRRPLAVHRVTSGTATASLAHPREVFRVAVAVGAACVMVAHNHPSGDPEPSSADVNITRQLREAGRVLGIELTDHIVIGDRAVDPSGRGYYSFQMSGLI